MKISLIIKFVIGFVAGLCAALLPRLSAEMVVGSNSDVLDLFNVNYLIVSAVFAVLIGTVTAILEWESSRSPKDIFMSALAIPGILSGALNTTVSVSNFEQSEAAKLKMEKILEDEFDIQTLPPMTIELPPAKTSFNSGSESLGLFNTSNAYASEKTIHKVKNYGVGIKKGEHQYIIVLDQAVSKKEAEKKTNALTTVIGKTRIIHYKKQVFLITTEYPTNKSEALIKAVRLKKKGLIPSLMEVK